MGDLIATLNELSDIKPGTHCFTPNDIQKIKMMNQHRHNNYIFMLAVQAPISSLTVTVLQNSTSETSQEYAIFFKDIFNNSNEARARIYCNPISEIRYRMNVAGPGGQHSEYASTLSQGISLSAYEFQTGTIIIPVSGYLDCTVSATISGSSSATCTLSVIGTNTGQVVSPSSLSFTASNF